MCYNNNLHTECTLVYASRPQTELLDMNTYMGTLLESLVLHLIKTEGSTERV